MLELSSLGAKVLQIRSVEVAMKFGVPIHVRSSFSDAEGTVVTKEDPALESVVVAGVTKNDDEARVIVRGVVDQPGLAASIFEALAERNISVDMIIQNVSEDGRTDVTFTVTDGEAEQAREIVEAAIEGATLEHLAGRVLTAWTGDPAAIRSYGTRFTRPVVVPDDDAGATVELSGTVAEVREEGGERIAVVDLKAAFEGKTVLGRARAEVVLPG